MTQTKKQKAEEALRRRIAAVQALEVSDEANTSVYSDLYNKIFAARNEAKAHGKRLSILLGEVHGDAKSCLLVLMVHDICHRLGITHQGFEADQASLDEQLAHLPEQYEISGDDREHKMLRFAHLINTKEDMFGVTANGRLTSAIHCALPELYGFTPHAVDPLKPERGPGIDRDESAMLALIARREIQEELERIERMPDEIKKRAAMDALIEKTLEFTTQHLKKQEEEDAILEDWMDNWANNKEAAAKVDTAIADAIGDVAKDYDGVYALGRGHIRRVYDILHEKAQPVLCIDCSTGHDFQSEAIPEMPEGHLAPQLPSKPEISLGEAIRSMRVASLHDRVTRKEIDRYQSYKTLSDYYTSRELRERAKEWQREDSIRR